MQLVDGITGMLRSSDDTCLAMQSVVCFIHAVPPSVFSRVDMFYTIAPTRSNPGCQLHVEDVSHFIYFIFV